MMKAQLAIMRLVVTDTIIAGSSPPSPVVDYIKQFDDRLVVLRFSVTLPANNVGKIHDVHIGRMHDTAIGALIKQ